MQINFQKRKKYKYVKQLDAAEHDSLTLSWELRQIGREDSSISSCFC